MIRKFAIAVAAIAALGTASLSTANAGGGGGKGGMGGGNHHFHGGHFRGGIGLGLYAVNSCYQNQWVVNRRGQTVLRTINVCDDF